MKQQPSISNDLNEVRFHGTKLFPWKRTFPERTFFVKRHWHDEAEILYFSGEAFRLESNMESFPIQSECF